MTGMPYHAIAARNAFDGITVLDNHAVIVDGCHIVDVVPKGQVPASMPLQVLPGNAWLAPGFIDVQVNGGGDVLFNDAPTAAAIQTIAAVVVRLEFPVLVVCHFVKG